MADLLKVMEREMLHSEHAARCFIEAKRRDTALREAKQLQQQGVPMTEDIKPPVRAFRLTLLLDADSRADMARALCNLADRLERDELTVGFWGGPSDGGIYELLTDPSMTHDAYHAALRAYLDQRNQRVQTEGEKP